MTRRQQPTVEIMTITPQMAENWLTRDHPRNRRLNEGKVAQYQSDMENGRWELSDQAISFGVDHNLINGKKRLTACSRAGVSFDSVVMHGLPKDSFLVLDGCQRRSTDDNFRIADKDWPRGCGPTVRRLLYGPAMKGFCAISDKEVDEFMQTYGEQVSLAHKILPSGKFVSSSIRAVVVRAAIGKAKKKMLERFGEVLQSGMMVPGDEAAILLRNFVLEVLPEQSGSRRELYRQAEAALVAFLEQKRLTKLVTTDQELFPIPGEEKPLSIATA
jgi:hypothetical protein